MRMKSMNVRNQQSKLCSIVSEVSNSSSVGITFYLYKGLKDSFLGVRYFPKDIFSRVTSQVTISQVATCKRLCQSSETLHAAMGAQRHSQDGQGADRCSQIRLGRPRTVANTFLGSCCLGNDKFEKLPLEKIPLGSCPWESNLHHFSRNHLMLLFKLPQTLSCSCIQHKVKSKNFKYHQNQSYVIFKRFVSTLYLLIFMYKLFDFWHCVHILKEASII